MKFDPYEELGLEPTATPEEVEKAFRERAKETHPDKGGDPAEFKRVTRAVVILRNPKKRKHYDETGDAGGEKAEQHPDIGPLAYIGQLVAKLCSMPQLEKVLHFDLAKQLVEGAKADVKVLRDQIVTKSQAIKRAEKLLDRFRRKGQGINFLDDGVKFFIKAENDGIAELERTIAKMERAVAILEEFEFDPYANPADEMLRMLEEYEPGRGQIFQIKYGR